MKFKERLWQLFLAIVLGVTLSVCDAGLQDDEFDSNALVAGSAIASGVTSGDGYVKIGDFMIVSGEKYISNTMEQVVLEQNFQDNEVLIFGSCQDLNTQNAPYYPIQKQKKLSNKFTPYELSGQYCQDARTLKYTIIGKFK